MLVEFEVKFQSSNQYLTTNLLRTAQTTTLNLPNQRYFLTRNSLALARRFTYPSSSHTSRDTHTHTFSGEPERTEKRRKKKREKKKEERKRETRISERRESYSLAKRGSFVAGGAGAYHGWWDLMGSVAVAPPATGGPAWWYDNSAAQYWYCEVSCMVA